MERESESQDIPKTRGRHWCNGHDLQYRATVAHHTACRRCTRRGPTRLLRAAAAMRSSTSLPKAVPQSGRPHTKKRVATRAAILSLRQIVHACHVSLRIHSLFPLSSFSLSFYHPPHTSASLARPLPNFSLSKALTNTGLFNMDSPGGSELFESYEQDFHTIKASINERITTSRSQHGEPRKATLRTADRQSDEASDILQQMEMELLNLPLASRTRLQARLRGCKSELERLKQTVKRAQTTRSTSERDELLGGLGAGVDLDAASMDQRTRLLYGTDKLAQTSKRLQDSHRIALETESLGAGILSDLRGQREQIIHSRNTLQEADSSIDKASRTLKGMARRMATNKLIAAAIIALLVLLILFVVFRKLSAPSDDP